MTRTGRVQAIYRAVMIMNCFNEDRRELKLSEISEMLDINKSTAHGIITTLKYHGLMDQDEETQKYKLGLSLLALGNIVKNSMNITGIAKPYIDKICVQVEETVHLGTLDKTEVVYLDKAESHQSMRIVTKVGARIPAYCTGIGKAMLAYKDKGVLSEAIPDKLTKYTPNTISDKVILLKTFELIKSQGYSIDDEEHDMGLRCVAAPIFDNNKEAKYAISVSGPAVRMTDKKIEYTKNIILNAAKEISHKLGYNKRAF